MVRCLGCILLALNWRTPKKKEPDAFSKLFLSLSIIFLQSYLLDEMLMLMRNDGCTLLEMFQKIVFKVPFSILKHLNHPIQPSEHTPILLVEVHTQVISGHLYFNDRSVSGKTCIRRSLERVIRGLSKINEPQFLCHFSPQKPFDKNLTRILSTKTI